MVRKIRSHPHDDAEELIEKSDVLLVLAPRDPKKHEELANLALRSGSAAMW